MRPSSDIGQTAAVSVDLYALACLRLMGFDRSFTIQVPDGIKPSELAQAFRRLGCRAAIHRTA